MDEEKIIKTLENATDEKLSGVEHVGTSEVMTFRAKRHNSNGDPQNVTITVEDHGEDAGLIRYRCTARSDAHEDIKLSRCKEAYGNAAETPDTVIQVLHWKDLD